MTAIKNNTMKTQYEQIEEMLIPLMVVGKISKDVVATILAKVQILETRVKVLEDMRHDRFAKEHAEHNNYDINDNVTVNGEGDE